MKYCKNCGRELPDSAKFCGGCGKSVEMLNENEYESSTVLNETVSYNDESVVEEKKKAKTKSKYFIIFGVVIVLVAIVSVICFGLKDKKSVKEYEQYIAMAENYVEELDYEQAVDTYLKAIEIKPKEREPYIRLAEIYLEQEEYDKAEEILDKADEAGAEQTFDQKEKAEEIKEQIKERESANDYSWIVEPTIEADDIFYLAGCASNDQSINEISKQADLSTAVIQIGDEFGLIDIDGNILTEVAYKEVYIHSGVGFTDDTYFMVRTAKKYDEEYKTEWEHYYLDETGTMRPIEYLSGGLYTVFYYYYEGIINKCSFTTGGELPDYSSKEILPVQKSSVKYEDNAMEIDDLSSKYAIEYNGTLVTDFIYDECGSCAEGLFAVCHDGKWGYINQQGMIVIPIEYDASWQKYPVARAAIVRSTEKVKDYCYAASDGYVVLRKGEEWELRDTEGEVVIPLGIFEAIRPVFDGKCWVKKDGKWGVIELENPESEVSKEMLEGIWLQENESDPDAIQIIFDLNGEVKYYPTVSHEDEYTTTYYLRNDQLIINIVHSDKNGITQLKYDLDYSENEKIKTCKITASEENKEIDVSKLNGWEENICGTYIQINLSEVKISLGVPEELEVDVIQSEISYWDTGQIYTTYISVEEDGTLVASATVDALTGELARNIMMYTKKSTMRSPAEICRIVEDHYNEEYNTDGYVVYEGECSERESGYYLLLRTTKGKSANELVCGVTVDLTTGKVVADFGETWYLD